MKMKKILIGNTFPLKLIRGRVLIQQQAVKDLQKEVEGREVVSYWGHSNTLEAAEKLLGFSVKPNTERPALSLDYGWPKLEGTVFPEAWIVTPNYKEGFRPAPGVEVSVEDILGWHVLHMTWE
jgi:hypothetical protein